ncbi:MAG: hypothetical protein GTO24_22530 [candidate division Zixibacteria bacterium]|nr:hypothetical protein [candidate division Zixibacteria bacterium]
MYKTKMARPFLALFPKSDFLSPLGKRIEYEWFRSYGRRIKACSFSFQIDLLILAKQESMVAEKCDGFATLSDNWALSHPSPSCLDHSPGRPYPKITEVYA